MEAVLWYVLSGTRGGPNLVRVLLALEERPRNTNQLADNLHLNYKTVRHHLDVLHKNNVVQTSGNEYGSIYLLTQEAKANWDIIEEIIGKTDELSTAPVANSPP